MPYGEIKSIKIERLRAETGLDIVSATTRGVGNHHLLLRIVGGSCVEYDPRTKTWKQSAWKWNDHAR